MKKFYLKIIDNAVAGEEIIYNYLKRIKKILQIKKIY